MIKTTPKSLSRAALALSASLIFFLGSASVRGDEPLLAGSLLARGHVGVVSASPYGDVRRDLFGTDPLPLPIPAPIAPVVPVEGRIPGEFEKQTALLIGCHQLIDETPELFVEIAYQTRGKLPIVALITDVEEYRVAKRLLQQNRIPASHVGFAEIQHDTMWARDYGPTIITCKNGSTMVLDAGYDATRSLDDRVPEELARLLKLPEVPVPLVVEGGNLLTNGQGLAIVTDQILDVNMAAGDQEQNVLETLRRAYGLQQVVMLESLIGEDTGHADMFATFTAANTIVVGQYKPQDDPENAAVLDRNAALLEGIHTPKGPLRVIRVPMPPRHDNVWRTYTNVVYANGTLLVPIYANLDSRGRHEAMKTFSRALPGWKLVGVDASRIIEFSGALHCISMNLGAVGKLPAFPTPHREPPAIEPDVSELGDPFVGRSEDGDSSVVDFDTDVVLNPK